MTDEPTADFDYAALTDKETLWWGLYRVLSALAHARACDPHCIGKADSRGGVYSVAHRAADYWGALIPGMPDPAKIAREVAQDISYHERTFAAERLGLRVTGDEFI